MTDTPNRYRSHDEDSARWLQFANRPEDIVISTRSKSGTTWMQMICALLIFRTADLPRPLGELSPWLDWLGATEDEVYSLLEAQHHRRFIKTHTPLDGLPLHPDVTYIVVARHPLDMAVSLYHQQDNIDRARLTKLTGNTSGAPVEAERPTVAEWLRSWIDWEGAPAEQLDSLPGVLWHLSGAWARRRDPNVVLIRYEDLLTDLEGQMMSLASTLGMQIDRATIATLSEGATFHTMKDRSDALAPDPKHILKSRAAFFRQGQAGAGTDALRDEDLARYHQRAETLAPPALLEWLHR